MIDQQQYDNLSNNCCIQLNFRDCVILNLIIASFSRKDAGFREFMSYASPSISINFLGELLVSIVGRPIPYYMHIRTR